MKFSLNMQMQVMGQSLSAKAAQNSQAAKSKKQVAIAEKLHVIEKHVRKNTLNVPFVDIHASGADSFHESGNVTSEFKARSLAFYIFYNVKPYDR